jgi:hypothetical protein
MQSINPSAIGEIIPECDKDLKPEDQTVFLFTQLTHEEQALLKDLSGAPGTQIDVACHLGLCGSKNFFTPSGDPVEWKRDPSKRPLIGNKRPWLKTLDFIPLNVRDELATKILKGVELSEQEVKNS